MIKKSIQDKERYTVKQKEQACVCVCMCARTRVHMYTRYSEEMSGIGHKVQWVPPRTEKRVGKRKEDLTFQFWPYVKA